ncbi:MAG: hypothetical protein M1140_00685 [Chloroflexi bacterium]|nr:hypothetical protein [Chloroflexota bacterium]
MQTSMVRNVTGGVVITVAALFVVFGVANAGKPTAPISAVKSPIPSPISVVLDCDDPPNYNPTCRTTATTTGAAYLYSYFYIDWRYRGPANRDYPTVCSTYYLRDGVHSARVRAVDTQRNSANVGPAYVIHCDRFGPVVYSYLYYGRYWRVYITPVAYDYGSGVDLSSRTLTVDGNDFPWQRYTDACVEMGLTRGYHSLVLSASDNAGHTTTSRTRWFYCPQPR